MLGELIPLALVVALSPLSIIPAVVLVLHTEHPRPAGLSFMVGWLVGIGALTAVFVALPHVVDGLNGPAPRWAPWLRIAVGLVTLAFAVWRWLTRKRATERPPAMVSRLSRITPAGAAAIGFVLAVANVKVVLMNAAAGLIIGTTARGVGAWGAVVFYTVLAGSSVVTPIVAYAVAGERVDPQLDRFKNWMQREHARLTAVVLAIIGVLLLYTGIRAF